MHRSTPYKYTHLTSLGYLTEWQKNITDGHTDAVGAREGKVTHTRMHTRPHAHTHTHTPNSHVFKVLPVMNFQPILEP